MPRSVTALGFLVVFVVLVGTTIGGIVQNWPRHRSIPGSTQFRPPKTYGADVVAVRTARCQAPGAYHCEVVTVRLTGGSDKGKETSLRFGDAGGSVSVGLGDKLLVYKNPLPP